VPIYSNGVDVISGISSFGIIADNLTASVGGAIITVSKTSFSRAPVEGDYVCETGKTCIPHIPEIAHPILAQAATVRVLEASNDTKGIQVASQTLAKMLATLRHRCQNRVKNAPKKVLAKNYILNLLRH
jgi:hypothetical protein